MKIGKRDLRQLNVTLEDLHMNLNVLDDTFGYSSLEDDQPKEGLNGTISDMRDMVNDMQAILDDEPTDEE